MANVILPELTVDMHGQLRAAWLDHVERGQGVVSMLVIDERMTEPAPLVLDARSAEPALLERDFLRRVANNPGQEITRRLGDAPHATPGVISIQQGHTSRLARWYTVGLQAVMRMLATGRQFGTSDLEVLVADGAWHPTLAAVFDDAYATFAHAQRELHVRFADRIGRVGLGSAPTLASAPVLGRSLER